MTAGPDGAGNGTSEVAGGETTGAERRAVALDAGSDGAVHADHEDVDHDDADRDDADDADRDQTHRADDGSAERDVEGSPPVADAVLETNRWEGVTALALFAGGVGVLYTRPVVLLLAVVGGVYAAYARSGTAPEVSLSAQREIDDHAPSPGDEVQVSVAVTNTGDRPLWDLRLVDDVPGALTVTGGSPRLATALRPGRTVHFSYTVTARRGVHAFDSIGVLARNLPGTHERRTAVRATGELVVFPALDVASDVGLRAATSRFTGRVPTRTGGEGIEFFATREYRPGDSPSRVDWNRYAATRDLATLEFRRERAATVVLIVDVRAGVRRAPEPGAPSALDLSVDGAGEVFAALTEAGDRVGIAGFGPRAPWLAPGTGSDHRERARRLLATAEAFSPAPPADSYYPRRQIATFRQRAPADAEFVVFSPVLDDYVGTVARRFQATGHPVTLVSPDPTATDDLVRRLAVVERRIRLDRLREARIRVVDWQPDEPLAVALERARERWS